MNKKSKSRKAVKLYTFNSSAGEVKINLNGYEAKCTQTGNSKSFYHSYLANLIVTKYDNNISTFEATYVSREGRGQLRGEGRVDELKGQIERAAARLEALQLKMTELAS